MFSLTKYFCDVLSLPHQDIKHFKHFTHFENFKHLMNIFDLHTIVTTISNMLFGSDCSSDVGSI